MFSKKNAFIIVLFALLVISAYTYLPARVSSREQLDTVRIVDHVSTDFNPNSKIAFECRRIENYLPILELYKGAIVETASVDVAEDISLFSRFAKYNITIDTKWNAVRRISRTPLKSPVAFVDVNRGPNDLNTWVAIFGHNEAKEEVVSVANRKAGKKFVVKYDYGLNRPLAAFGTDDFIFVPSADREGVKSILIFGAKQERLISAISWPAPQVRPYFAQGSRDMTIITAFDLSVLLVLKAKGLE